MSRELRRRQHFLPGANDPRLAQIQLSFETPQHLIIDPAFIAQANCGFTLHPQDLQRKLLVPIVVRSHLLITVA